MPLRRERYKDKEKFLRTRAIQRKRYYDKTAHLYDGPKRKWTKEEMLLLFNNPITDTELSAIIERSVKSIQVKRSKIKVQLNNSGVNIEDWIEDVGVY